MSIVHHTARVHIYKISILVVCINVSVFDIVPFRGLLSTVINILYTFKLEFLAFFRAVSIGEVVADIESAVELHVILRQMLTLGGDTVHVVVAHVEGVGRRFAVSPGVCASCRCKAV